MYILLTGIILAILVLKLLDLVLISWEWILGILAELIGWYVPDAGPE